ncbi:hypothetical protein CkaCkLH20_05734 [Colletotrichum karsti]|uniref:Secreted protein n=1 Tax=Colletotrichum karsti TaxID=1095194 RepID=A0A9P6I5R0_9PEZI|nr:uncharacterized protein CkaCkLH20_05734 [Colletotrichum karsti]KAF9876888.1 hypothetical protein CkaCkLH20_05734 [Colletotrichum karsti]
MRFSTVFAAATAALSAGVEGYLVRVGLPKTIKLGDVWEARVNTAIQQPRQDLVVWGASPAGSTYPGSIGIEFARTKLDDALSGGYNDTIPGLTIPEGLRITPGEWSIQAVILQWAGAAQQPSLETYFWNVTIGDVTSEELVWQVARGPQSTRCNLQ